VPIETYFDYCLFTCTMHFFHTHLKCCLSCGLTTHDNLSFCHDDCSDCSHTPNHSHRHVECPKNLLWLHDPTSSHYNAWKTLVQRFLSSETIPPFTVQN
jgi:hypothetical protein